MPDHSPGVVHGVRVERATVRTTWTPWAAPARLCLGRRCAGQELAAHAWTTTVRVPLRPRPLPRTEADGVLLGSVVSAHGEGL